MLYTASFAQTDSVPKKDLDEVKLKYEFIKTQTDQLQKSIKEERKAHYDFVENTYTYITIIAGVFAAIVIFFGWKSFDGFKESLKRKVADFDEQADRKMADMITDLVSENEKTVLGVIEKHDLENKIKRDTKIVLLQPKVIDFDLTKLLGDFNVQLENLDDYYTFDTIEKQDADGNSIKEITASIKKPIPNSDLIIINNTGIAKVNLSFGPADTIIDNYSERKILFFKTQLIPTKLYENVAAVNMPAQLIGNMMSMLKY